MIIPFNAPIHTKGDYFAIGNILTEYVEDELKTQIKIYSPDPISADQIVLIRQTDVSYSPDIKIYQCQLFVDKHIIPISNTEETLPPEQCLVVYAKYYYELARQRDLFVINGKRESAINNPELEDLYQSMLNTYIDKLPILYVIRTNKYHMQMHCNVVLSQLTDEETDSIISQLFE